MLGMAANDLEKVVASMGQLLTAETFAAEIGFTPVAKTGVQAEERCARLRFHVQPLCSNCR